eukprot:813976-Amphidinium_carterae.1
MGSSGRGSARGQPLHAISGRCPSASVTGHAFPSPLGTTLQVRPSCCPQLACVGHQSACLNSRNSDACGLPSARRQLATHQGWHNQ